MKKKIAAFEDAGARIVRVLYADLHGIARGKDIPISHFEHLAEEGVAFCEAIMTVDLRHNVVAGFETGFKDIAARPDLDSAVMLPWDPTVVCCLADLYRVASDEPYPIDGRAAVRRACEAFAERGLSPIVGPELEFYLCEPGTWRRYVSDHSPVYTVGTVADPRGVLREMLESCGALGLDVFAANQEYGRSQYEINLRHSHALDAADRAFRFKNAIKEIACRHGLLATFMGKPWSDDEGSGLHLHVSLNDADGANAFADEADGHGVSALARQFVAGVLEHMPALTALLNPTVNAYRRMVAESLAPTNVNWGYDNRLALVRIPDERGRATRAEIRSGDGAANLYLAIAGILFAGLDGIRRELSPPPPVAGNPYELGDEELGGPLPSSLGDALAALEADDLLVEALGRPLVETFLTIKRYELDRWLKHLSAVTDWELEEYAHHL